MKSRSEAYHTELTPLDLDSVADGSAVQQTVIWKCEVEASVCIKTEHGLPGRLLSLLCNWERVSGNNVSKAKAGQAQSRVIAVYSS